MSMTHELHDIWAELAAGAQGDPSGSFRRYRRLDLNKETGFRLACHLPDRSLEMLLEVALTRNDSDYRFPSWKGMEFDLLTLDVPVPQSKHVCLRLQKPEYEDVFTSLCADLALELQDVDIVEQRERMLDDFLDRWSSFFERHGVGTLSFEREIGLFGELWWLRRLLDSGLECATAIDAWHGCRHAFHDFQLAGRVVEVKATLSKEPKKVWINNERQLDCRGLESLHLLVLSIIASEAGGETLAELIETLRHRASTAPGCRRRLDRSLQEAGFLDTHASKYTTSFTVAKEELFSVSGSFPRIVDLPPGTGDLTYSLLVGSLAPFTADAEEYLNDVCRRTEA